jgi:hypothetical protein
VPDFKAIGGALCRQWLDDWWQPAKPEQELKAAESRPGEKEVGRVSLSDLVDRTISSGL